MRHSRLPILFVLIAAALGWLHFALRAPPEQARSAAAVNVPAATPPAQALPAPAAAVASTAATPVAPVKLPPKIDIAPLKVPPGDDEAAEPPPPVADDAPAETPAIDANHATELFADLLTQQDGEATEAEANDPAHDLWKRYDGEQADADWAPAATARIEEALHAWIDALPDGVGDHIALVRVECRATLCQVLAADNDAGGRTERADGGQEWQQAVASLRAQPWWNESGFGDPTVQVTSRDDYELYTAYLPRNPPPTDD